MESNRQLVYWRGRLRKDEREATCTVQVWEVKNPQGGPPTYAQHRVIKAPTRLRDGIYDLETEGHTLRVRRLKGFWHTADATERDDIRERPRIFKDIVTVAGVVSLMLVVLVVARFAGGVSVR